MSVECLEKVQMFCGAFLRVLIRRQKSFAYFTGRPANHFQAADLARFVSSVHRSSALRIALFKAGRVIHLYGNVYQDSASVR